MKRFATLFLGLFSIIAAAQVWEATRLGPQQWELTEFNGTHISWHQQQAEAQEKGQAWSLDNDLAAFQVRHTGTSWIATADAQLVFGTPAAVPANEEPVWHAIILDPQFPVLEPVDFDQALLKDISYSLDLNIRTSPTEGFNGDGTLTYSVLSGTLPTGLTLTSGVVSGTPTVEQTQAVNISSVLTSTGRRRNQVFVFTVEDPDGTPPTVPPNPSVFRLMGFEETILRFDWDDSVDPSGIGDYGFWIAENEADCNSETGTATSGFVLSPTHFDITGLSGDTTRWGKVRAIDNTAQESAHTACIGGTTDPAGSPTGVLQAFWGFEDDEDENIDTFPTDGPRPSLSANPRPPIPIEMAINSDQPLIGDRSLRIFLDGVDGNYQRYRNQLKIRANKNPCCPNGSSSGFSEFGEYWLGWAQFVPASHDTASNEYEIVFQSLWQHPEPVSGGRNPLVVIEMGDAIGGNYTTYSRYIEEFEGDKTFQKVAWSEVAAPIAQGWNGFVMHMIFDAVGSTGLGEVWMRNSATDGWEQYVNYTGKLGPNDGLDSHGTWDLGWYKGWKSNQACDTDPVCNRLMYIDEIRYAFGDGNFDLVAPLGIP